MRDEAIAFDEGDQPRAAVGIGRVMVSGSIGPAPAFANRVDADARAPKAGVRARTTSRSCRPRGADQDVIAPGPAQKLHLKAPRSRSSSSRTRICPSDPSAVAGSRATKSSGRFSRLDLHEIAHAPGPAARSDSARKKQDGPICPASTAPNSGVHTPRPPCRGPKTSRMTRTGAVGQGCRPRRFSRT